MATSNFTGDLGDGQPVNLRMEVEEVRARTWGGAVPDPDWTFTDHERVVAEKDARIKELEGQVETGYRAGVNAATGRVLGAVKETLDRHGAPPFAQSLDIEPAYSTLYRLVLAALTDSGANNE